MRVCLLLAALVPLTNTFLFNLPGLTPPAAPAQCCCPPPPPPCGGGGGYGPPPPPSYASGGYNSSPYRKRRSTISGELEASSEDALCNSPSVRKIIMKSMSESETEARAEIHRRLKEEGRDMVVLCSPHSFNFTASHDSEYCSVAGETFTCYAFVF